MVALAVLLAARASAARATPAWRGAAVAIPAVGAPSEAEVLEDMAIREEPRVTVLVAVSEMVGVSATSAEEQQELAASLEMADPASKQEAIKAAALEVTLPEAVELMAVESSEPAALPEQGARLLVARPSAPVVRMVEVEDGPEAEALVRKGRAAHPVLEACLRREGPAAADFLQVEEPATGERALAEAQERLYRVSSARFAGQLVPAAHKQDCRLRGSPIARRISSREGR